MFNTHKNIFLVLLLVITSVVITALITLQISNCPTVNNTKTSDANKKFTSNEQGISLEEASRSYPAYPSKYTVQRLGEKEVKINITPEGNHVGYHVYRHCTYLDNTPTDLKDYEWTLVGMVDGKGSGWEFIDRNAKPEKCLYVLTSFNRWGNESSKGAIRVVEKVSQ